MAALVASLKGKVLVKIGDNEPVEIGTIDIPINLSTSLPAPPPFGAVYRPRGPVEEMGQ